MNSKKKIISLLLAACAFAELATSNKSAAAQEFEYRWVSLRSNGKPSHGCYTVKDKKVFEFDGEALVLVEGADTATFQVATKDLEYIGCWAKDKDHLFQGPGIIKNADLKNFVLIDHQSGKDKNLVYCAGALNPPADPKTFQKLRSPHDKPHSQFWYYKDAKHVFNKWCTFMPEADAETFEMVHNPTVDFDARDKNHIYALGSKKRKN